MNLWKNNYTKDLNIPHSMSSF